MSGAASDTSTAQPGAAADPSLPGACTLLTSDEIAAILGAPQTANPETADARSGIASCTWGSLVNGHGLVAVTVARPQASGVNIADILVTGSGGTADAETVPLGDDGKLLKRGVMPGGGGTGRTVYVHTRGLTVLVAGLGERVNAPALTSAARSALAKLP